MTDQSPNEPQVLEGSVAFAAKAAEILAAARSEVWLFSEALDRRVYASEEFAEAVKAFLLRTERARLRLLLNQPQAALRQAPRLIELARRLTSRVEIRESPEEKRQSLRGEWLIADRHLLLERHAADALQSQYWPQAPGRTHQRAQAFEELWGESEPAQESRALDL